MFKSYFLLGLVVSLISSLGAAVYVTKYYEVMANFSLILPLWKIIATYFTLGLSVSGLCFLSNRLAPKFGTIIFNIVLVFATLSSILFPIMKEDFPETLEMTEFYPGFVIPLYFIFPLFWLALSPLIQKNEI
mgnify:FL=1|jgi:hypothetical protein